MFPWPKGTSELAGYVYPGWIRVEGPRTRIRYLYASQLCGRWKDEPETSQSMKMLGEILRRTLPNSPIWLVITQKVTPPQKFATPLPRRIASRGADGDRKVEKT